MSEKDIIWTGDLDDDCTAIWGNLMLRAEEMDKKRWWWCVYDIRNNETQISSSNEYDVVFKTGQNARDAAEEAARVYLFTKDRKVIEAN